MKFTILILALILAFFVSMLVVDFLTPQDAIGQTIPPTFGECNQAAYPGPSYPGPTECSYLPGVFGGGLEAPPQPTAIPLPTTTPTFPPD